MFGISGGGNTITADNLQNIEPLNGLYEYRFEVLPNEPNTNSGKITLTITDESGSVITRQASAKAFNANICSGVKVYWDDATITMDKPLSWYEDTTAGKISELSGKSIYVKNISIKGAAIDEIQEIGAYFDTIIDNKISDEQSYKTARSIALTTEEIQISAPVSGLYEVIPYAILKNGKKIYGSAQKVTVTDELYILPHYTIKSSYSENGSKKLDNELDGDKIYATVSINDAYAAENLIQSAKFYYGDKSLDIDAKGTRKDTGSIAYQVYSCYAEIVFTNDYSLKTDIYTTNVTGIPYNISFKDTKNPTGWSCYNQDTKGNYLYLKKETSYAISPRFFIPESVNVNVIVPVHAYKLSGTYKPNIYISASESGIAGGNPTQLNGDIYVTSGVKFTNITSNLTLSSSISNICIYASGNSSGAFNSHPEAGIQVQSFDLKYEL